ncbi:unnamed protein product, partial [Coregonus sp. 'balchen']
AGFMTGGFELRSFLFYGGCGFTIMRCMSFALENCEKKEGNYSILELLKYNFYLPFFYFGPIMTFDKFYVQVNKADLTRKEGAIWNISLQGLVQLGAILTVDILFHFLYILSIPTDMKLLKHMSDWAVVGLAYYSLVYDWVKAAVMFGVINTVSRLDHLDPPQPPKCITMLYVFSETYVYDYLGGKHDNLWDEAIATLCTFGITVLWLGPCQVVAVFNTFNFWTIILYNVIALNSLEFTKLVAKRLLLKVTYCLVQLIKERERRQVLIDDPDPIPPPAPVPPPTPTTPTVVTSTAPIQPVVDPSKEKAE